MILEAAARPVFPDRLDFQLPDFTRISWVSESARDVWEPRFAAISRAWSHVQWSSVQGGVRACALVRIPESSVLDEARRWMECGLDVLPLQLESGSPTVYRSTVRPFEAGQESVV